MKSAGMITARAWAMSAELSLPSDRSHHDTTPMTPEAMNRAVISG